MEYVRAFFILSKEGRQAFCSPHCPPPLCAEPGEILVQSASCEPLHHFLGKPEVTLDDSRKCHHGSHNVMHPFQFLIPLAASASCQPQPGNPIYKKIIAGCDLIYAPMSL